MSDIELSIVIPVHNNANFTKSALKDLMKLPGDHEIIVVNNGSDDDTEMVVLEAQSKCTCDTPHVGYIKFEKNRGFGGANNAGYMESLGNNVLFLNNDIRVKSNYRLWTFDLISYAKKGYIVGTQGGLLDDELNFVTEGMGLPQTNLWYMSGWCMCGSKETFDRLKLNHYRDFSTGKMCNGMSLGPWNELFFAYFEDDDLSFRAKKLGIKFKEVKIPVHHFGRMTGRQLDLQKMYIESRELFRQEWLGKI